MGAEPINRRYFLKVSGATAAVAVTGIEGIVAAGRAPAFAQGTKLHWVRWVDFIPESDVELKRQMPEASKALGAEVTLSAPNRHPRAHQELLQHEVLLDPTTVSYTHLTLPTNREV